jgi:hypothetical protein
MRHSLPSSPRLLQLWTSVLLLFLCSIVAHSPARAASPTQHGLEDEFDYGSSHAAGGDESDIIMSISFRGVACAGQGAALVGVT